MMNDDDDDDTSCVSDSMFLSIDFVRVTNCFYDYDYDYDFFSSVFRNVPTFLKFY